MKFVLISDTHGDHRKLQLPRADTIVHAGDLSADGDPKEVRDFIQWFDGLDYSNKILIAGNHDWHMQTHAAEVMRVLADSSINYLLDSGIEIDGIRFWGSPFTPEYFNWAFQCKKGDEMDLHWKKIPDNTHVLITHGPPYGIMDKVPEEDGTLSHAGCARLLRRIRTIKPALHIFGHIHEGFGEQKVDGTHFYNVSSMNAAYQIHNPPVVLNYSPV